MAVLDIDERNFAAEIMDSELPVLLEFSAQWCGPCKTMAPELDALSRELEGKAKIARIDIDRSRDLAREFGVQSVPTFVVMHQGRPVNGAAGAQRKAQLMQLLEPLLPRTAGALKPAEVARLLGAGQVVAVDTRDPAAYFRTHLPRAINLPLQDVQAKLAELARLRAVPVLYCRGGDKTKDLAQSLAQQGVPISFLEGGLLDWEALGLPVERS
jgi:thioredoxin